MGREDGLQVGARGSCDPAKRSRLAWGVAPVSALARLWTILIGELIFTGPTKPLAVRSALLEVFAMRFTPGMLEGGNGRPLRTVQDLKIISISKC